MHQKMLVTGANGFVGRQLCSELVRQGHTVRAAVRDETRAAGLPCAAVTVGSIGERTDWTRALRDVDTVIHLAARVHVMKDTSADPLEAFRAVNVHASAALARAAAAHGVRRLVFVSSVKVNGEATTDRPFSRDDPARPLDPYGISKCEAERALRAVANQTGLELVTVRPPLVYGPRVGGNFLRLLDLVHRGIPLPLGAVENRRSMVYNGNLAHALVLCAVHPLAGGKTYLVSDDEDLSTAELVRRLAGGLGKTARLWPAPASMLKLAGVLTGKAAEIDRLTGSLRVDSRPMHTELDWSPPFSVDEGIAETAKWFACSRT